MAQKTKSKQALATAAVVAAAVFWGCMGLFVRRLSAAGLDNLDIALVRTGVGLLGVGVYLLLFHRDKLRVRPKDLWCFFGTGIVSLLFFTWCYFHAIQATSLAVAGILLYTAPIIVMLLSVILFREKLTVLKIAALGLAFAGCVLVSGTGSGEPLTPQALLYGLGAGLGYALYSIFSRYAVNRGYEAWTITFYTFVFCVIGCLPLADLGAIVRCVAADPRMLLWYLAMGLLTAMASYLLYTWALEHLESSRASIIASVEPVVAAVAGVVVYHERLGWTSLLGIALVLSAVVLLSLGGKNVNNP